MGCIFIFFDESSCFCAEKQSVDVYRWCFDQSVVAPAAEGYKCEAVAVETSATEELNARAGDISEGKCVMRAKLQQAILPTP